MKTVECSSCGEVTESRKENYLGRCKPIEEMEREEKGKEVLAFMINCIRCKSTLVLLINKQ